MGYHEVVDFSKFKVPSHWPADAQAFAHEAISEIQELKAALKQGITDIITMQGALGKAQEENRDLKAKLGTNSSNSHLPPSKDPPGAPSREVQPSGQNQGAQKGHRGSGRALFPPERVDPTREVCKRSLSRPAGGQKLRPMKFFERGLPLGCSTRVGTWPIPRKASNAFGCGSFGA